MILEERDAVGRWPKCGQNKQARQDLAVNIAQSLK